MDRKRVAALGVLIALVVVAGGAYAVTGGSAGDEVSAAASTTTSTEPPTTEAPTTEPPTTEAPTTTAPPPPSDQLARGSSGPKVEELQRRLTELRFDPGPADGQFGVGTMYAVQAFQKLNGQQPTGVVTPETWSALAAPAAPQAFVPNGGGERVEIDLRTQLLYLYDGGSLRLITHVSTGSGERYCVKGDCGVARTPPGSYRFMWRYSGWRESRLGKLYNPVYFTGSGIAVHGSKSVPTYPASHGCVRIPMHIAEYFPSLVQRGDPVYVLDGKTAVGPPPETTDAGPPPDDPPTAPEDDPETTTTTTAPPTTTTTEPVPAPTPTEPPAESSTTTTTSTTAPPPPSSP